MTFTQILVYINVTQKTRQHIIARLLLEPSGPISKWMILISKFSVLAQCHFFNHPNSRYNEDIIEGFRSIVFIFIVISTTFLPICPPAFFRCLWNSGTYTELRITSFIEFTGVACSDSVSHNRVQVLSIPVLLLACSQDWTCNLQMIVSLEA